MTAKNKLSGYIYLKSDLPKIKFDEYGRPYLQDSKGKLMLSRSLNFHYSISN